MCRSQPPAKHFSASPVEITGAQIPFLSGGYVKPSLANIQPEAICQNQLISIPVNWQFVIQGHRKTFTYCGGRSIISRQSLWRSTLKTNRTVDYPLRQTNENPVFAAGFSKPDRHISKLLQWKIYLFAGRALRRSIIVTPVSDHSSLASFWR